jgi:SNF2 family DNA or RNA helicase
LVSTDIQGTSRYFRQKPYAHQLEAVEAAAGRPAFAYLLEMGCGKSAILVAEIASLFASGAINAAVVIAPKSLCLTWQKEQLPTHLPKSISRVLSVVFDSAPSKATQELYRELFTEDPLCLKILIINVEAISLVKGFEFAQAFLRAHHALLAVDESTRIKSPTAKRTKNAIKLAKLARYRRILSGMPITQSPLDIYCQYEFLGPNLLGATNYHAFKHRYAVVRRRVINGRSFDEVVGYQRLDELQRLVGNHAYRKLKDECLDLPAKVYKTIRVGMTAEQGRVYENLRLRALSELVNGPPVTAPLMLTRLLRLRQVLANALVNDDGEEVDFGQTPRMDALLELVEDVPGKVVIWSSFVKPIIDITEKLNEKFGRGSAAAFYGDTPDRERQKIVERFQDGLDPLRFFVGQVHTGGLGITLTRGTTVIYHDHDWSLEARVQSEDRCHRIGQSSRVTYIDLVASGTIDELILGALRSKKNLADQVTGDKIKLALGRSVQETLALETDPDSELDALLAQYG